MYKIAILGCENSHADNFLRLIGKPPFDDIEVLGVYSEEPEAAERLHDTYGVSVASTPDEFAGHVDGVMITARHGDRHLPYARPYLESGIPLFIDKPIIVSEKDAEHFRTLLEEKGIPVSGGSSCALAPTVKELKAGMSEGRYPRVTGGYFRAPLSSDSVYGGFYFYAQHGVQIMTEVFGIDALSVRASRVGDSVTAVFRYPEYCVTVLFSEHSRSYFASIAAHDKTEGGAFSVTEEMFREELSRFHDLLKGEPQKKSYREFFAPVYFMNAVERSLKSGREETING